MATPSFLDKSNNSSVPVSFLAKESSAPKFLGKEVNASNRIRIKADFALAQLVWFKPADLDLRAVCKEGNSFIETFFNEQETKFAKLNEDSGVSGRLEYDINPYTGNKENCFSELLYMGNAQEQYLLLNFFELKDRNFVTFASLDPMARLVMLEEVSPATSGGFLGFGAKPAVMKPVHYIDVIFSKTDSQNDVKSWLNCFKLVNNDDGFYTVEYVGGYTKQKPQLDPESTPRNRIAKILPSF
jgi:hypothetical protein